MSAAAAVTLAFELLAKLGPTIYDYVKALLDGGASAEELRNKPFSLSIAFGGGPGKAIEVQLAVEGEMADPNAD